jgi:DNA-binding CsgD family transcriptional regulator
LENSLSYACQLYFNPNGLAGTEASTGFQGNVHLLVTFGRGDNSRHDFTGGARRLLFSFVHHRHVAKLSGACNTNGTSDGGHRTFFTTRAAEMLLSDFSDRFSSPQPQASPRSRLTSREREFVQLLAEGKSSKEVAVALGTGVKTAETHRANFMRELQVHSVSELVRYAIKNCVSEARSSRFPCISGFLRRPK